jgi:hypothetical protein
MSKKEYKGNKKTKEQQEESAQPQPSIFIKSHEFGPTKDSIKFDEVVWGATGFGSVNYKYNGNNLLIQTPKLRTPFGFSKGMPNTPSFGKDFNCQFNLDSSSQKNKCFLDSLLEFEKVIVQYALDHRDEWQLFGNHSEAERATIKDIQSKYSPMVKPAKDPRFAPNIKLNFRTRTDKETKVTEITSECHDDKNAEIIPSETTIPRNAQCILIISGKQIWISPDRKFGVKWQIERIKVYPPENNVQQGGAGLPSGTCLIDSDDE